MFSQNFEEKSKIFPPHSSEEVFTFNPIRLSESLGHFLSYDPPKDELVNKRRMTSRRTRRGGARVERRVQDEAWEGRGAGCEVCSNRC